MTHLKINRRIFYEHVYNSNQQLTILPTMSEGIVSNAHIRGHLPLGVKVVDLNWLWML